ARDDRRLEHPPGARRRALGLRVDSVPPHPLGVRDGGPAGRRGGGPAAHGLPRDRSSKGRLLNEVFGFHAPLGMIALRSAIIYFVVVLGMRLAGRRQLGHMTPFALGLIMLLANAVQDAMVGPDATLLCCITEAATLILLNE